MPQLDRLAAEKLLTPSEIEQIKKGPKDPAKPVIAPSGWMYWNVHLDGLEKTHDIIVEREGVFRECILAMRMAKILGYQVATNTTVYRETDVDGNRASCSIIWRLWVSMVTRFHPATTTMRPKKIWPNAWVWIRQISS